MQSPYLGMRLADAENLLKKAGIPYEIRESAPDWKKNPMEGELRIIRVDESGNEQQKLILVVCRVSTTTRQL